MHRRLREPTPCLGCENEPPAHGPANETASFFYETVYRARNEFGGLCYDVLLSLMGAYDLTPAQHRLILRKVLAAERALDDRRAERRKKEDPPPPLKPGSVVAQFPALARKT